MRSTTSSPPLAFVRTPIWKNSHRSKQRWIRVKPVNGRVSSAAGPGSLSLGGNAVVNAHLKRTLRKLKQVEKRIRFGDALAERTDLVWNRFFSTNENERTVKYPLHTLLAMDRQGVKQVIEEYFYYVYYQMYKEGGSTLAAAYDPMLLSTLGLPPHAGPDEVKSRFRELAKKYHPDHGGDHEQMLALLETYRKLTAP
jgi:hypothetical protein